MKNFIQPGHTITLTAPTDINSGSGVLVGSIFGIACNDALAGTDVELKLTGVFTMPKVPTETWAAGNLIYWDRVSNLASTMSHGSIVGVAIAVSTNPSGSGLVRLNGSFGYTVDNTASHTENLIYDEHTGMSNSMSNRTRTK